MRYCKCCVEPDTRPGQIFDDEGVCLPCRIASQKEVIDWEGRARELQEIIAWGRARKTSSYDCLIGVSGGKDSTRQALYVRDLGLKPLLVCCTYPPEQVTERGAANLANLCRLGFDVITASPAPQLWRRLMRHGFLRFGNWCKATELALYTSIPKVAIAYHIPLVFLGENPALAWGTDVGSQDSDANNMRVTHTLAGGDVKPLLDEGVEVRQLFWWRYPPARDFERAGIRMVYLGYFMKDFNDYENARVSIENGLRVREGRDADPAETGSINNFDALDDDFVHLNQMFKYFKFGFGKVSQQVSGAVRNAVMSREEAVALVRSFDGKCHPRFVRHFCDVIGITEAEYRQTADRFHNPDIWEQAADGEWRMKQPLT
jgi:N-acetyl sugar amidotransferase